MNFNDAVINPLLNTLVQHKEKRAFCIDDKFYTYGDLAKAISKIRHALRGVAEKNIALAVNDDLETYASIFALWLEGKSYVPLHPLQPINRCLDIVSQVGMKTVLDSSAETRYEGLNVVMTRQLPFEKPVLEAPLACAEGDLAYVLFTSGSTGRPKGVRITRGNVAAFVEAFQELGITITEEDRCLQMFDLTFDVSVQSYLIPALQGACTYTVSPKQIKYQAVFSLLDEHKLTFSFMVPSVIHYLSPYLDEIHVPEMRYSLFAGEGLPVEDTERWSKCVPNAAIMNVYGPTEDTIYCTCYRYERDKTCKEVNGIMSIGRAMKGVRTMIVDDACRAVGTGEKGELCLAGAQLTPGYWGDEERNKESFFIRDGLRYYKTGDICAMDEEGDIAYYGRKDSQVKIQGFRIELSEIEYVARKFFDDRISVVALPVYDQNRNCTIHLAVENKKEGEVERLLQYLRKYLPAYMIPQEVNFIPRFPLNMNNKIDRKKIAELI